MSGTETRILPPLRLVPGLLFNGTPCEIALEDAVVGNGSTARIRRGYIWGPYRHVVAVKVFGELLDDARKQLLRRELHFAREVSMSHPSILGFLGTATVGEQTAIISDYIHNGNLMEYIRKVRDSDHIKKPLILQVAEAVEFLHVEKKLVHGDLKCVLHSVLAADFGLSSFIEKSDNLPTTMTAIRQMNTLQFAAPELLGLIGEVELPVSRKTTASDIYAFGMLILEAVSEQRPWGNKNNLAIITSVSARQHPPRPTLDGTFVAMSHSWWDVCRGCWRFVSDERPQISEVLHTLKASELLPSRELLFHARMGTAAYMPDGQTIAVASNQSIVLFNTVSRHARNLRLPASSEFPYHNLTFAISPDGLHIAYMIQKTIVVLDAESSMLVTSMQQDDDVPCAVYSPDGAFIASGTSDGPILFWNAATGDAIERRLEGHTQSVTSVSFSPDGISFASASYDGTIRLWDAMTCTARATLALPGVPDCAYSIDFSPDGMHIVSGYSSGMVIIWDVRARCPAHIFNPQSGGAFDVAFSPSGKYVAAALEGGSIQLWDAQDGSPVGAPLIGEDCQPILSVAFSQNGKNIVSATRGGIVRLWELFD